VSFLGHSLREKTEPDTRKLFPCDYLHVVICDLFYKINKVFGVHWAIHSTLIKDLIREKANAMAVVAET